MKSPQFHAMPADSVTPAPRHSPEPWVTPETGPDIFDAETRRVEMHRLNRLRIVECVNGCATIPHPEAIPQLVKAARKLQSAFLYGAVRNDHTLEKVQAYLLYDLFAALRNLGVIE